MKRMSISEVLARANASMVEQELDVTGAVATILAGIMEALPADAAAVMVESHGALEVLAATSHRALELELHQRQANEGPCLDAIRTGEERGASGADDLAARWPVTGPAIVAAGYRSIEAVPMRWQGRTFGGLNIFRSAPTTFVAQRAECRALADAVTLVLVAGTVTAEHLSDAVEDALKNRAVVEQAKGVLAETQSLDMPEAFDALVSLAQAEGVTLGVAARDVVQRASIRPAQG